MVPVKGFQGGGELGEGKTPVEFISFEVEIEQGVGDVAPGEVPGELTFVPCHVLQDSRIGARDAVPTTRRTTGVPGAVRVVKVLDKTLQVVLGGHDGTANAPASWFVGCQGHGEVCECRHMSRM